MKPRHTKEKRKFITNENKGKHHTAVADERNREKSSAKGNSKRKRRTFTGAIAVDQQINKFCERTGKDLRTISKECGVPYKRLVDLSKGVKVNGSATLQRLLAYLQSEKVSGSPTNSLSLKFTKYGFRFEPPDFAKCIFTGIAGFAEITSENMKPEFPPRTLVAIKALPQLSLLDWGIIYFIVDKNLCGSLRRVYPGTTDGTLLLKSDHPDKKKYPDFERALHDIDSIFTVVARIIRY